MRRGLGRTAFKYAVVFAWWFCALNVQAGITISGKVTDTNSVPLNRVMVTVSVQEEYMNSFTFSYTDANGMYEEAVLSEGECEVRARAEGYVEESRSFPISEGMVISNVDFALLDEAVICGCVTDEFDVAVTGVAVRAQNIASAFSVYGKTDAYGDYRCKGLPAGEYVLHTSIDGAENYLDEWHNGVPVISGCDRAPTNGYSVDIGDVTSNVNFVVSRGSVITGTVMDEWLEPLTNISVQVRSRPCGKYRYVSTGSDGQYRIQGIPKGFYELQFYTSAGYNSHHRLLSVDQPETIGNIIMEQSNDSVADGEIEIKVVDKDGVSMEGVAVEPVRKYDSGSWSMYSKIALSPYMTDSNGIVVLQNVGYGDYRIDAEQNAGNVIQQADVYVQISSNSPHTNVLVRMVEGAQISGHLQNGAGEPLEDLYVFVLNPYGGRARATCSDSNGFYQLERLEAESYHVGVEDTNGVYAGKFYADIAMIDGNCFVPTGATPLSLTTGAKATNINFSLERGAQLSGRVADEHGFALSGITMELVNTNSYLVASGHTEDNGCYVLNGVCAGDYYVSASDFPKQYEKQWYQNGFGERKVVALESSADVRDIDFVLERQGCISGTVKNEKGDPLIGVSITLDESQTGWGAGYAYTDSNGYYSVCGLSDMEYQLVVEEHNGLYDSSQTNVTLSTLDRTVNFEMKQQQVAIESCVISNRRIQINWYGGKDVVYQVLYSKDLEEWTNAPSGPRERNCCLQSTTSYGMLEYQMSAITNATPVFLLLRIETP